ncbi:Hypothetical predicted protein [Mytilus galloprovincialis]|uniref:CCHC-type domain-containing protein n=1 Tax=Mytilus galloprovincialis TaxID=29158 RepID=A0A8B6BX78_MYTGA|nr:Hypothetical predicted protein [Mytilus galloprovincialis]
MTKSNTQEPPNMASYAAAFKNGPKSDESDFISSVKPVFSQESDLFGSITNPMKSLYLTTNEMFEAIDKVVPKRSIKGLQRIRGLWRIYLDDEKERELLVSNGLELRGRSVLVYSRNPRVRSYENSTDIKIRVKDIPLSADDGQILRVLERYKCVILKHFRERLRYDNMITDCQTGDRIVICQGRLDPKKHIGKYRGTVLYRGQNDSIAKCSKCMELGHRASQCQNDWKCRNCGESGHKQIDFSKIDSAEGESIPHNNIEYNEDDTSYYPSHQSKSESDNNDVINDDETQHTLGDAQPDDLLKLHYRTIAVNPNNCQCRQKQMQRHKKLIHQQLRPKVFPARKSGPTNKQANPDHVKQSRNTGQSQMTQFMQVTNQESRSTKKNENKQVNTPGKSTSGRGIEKSPVTPTEQLHDGTRNNANKRSKTAS